MDQLAVRYNGMDFALRGEKSRYVLPSAFRKEVIKSSAGQRVLCLAKHHKWNCLTAFGRSREASFDELVAREAERQTRLGNDFDIDAYSHNLHAFEPVPFDPSGRFVLPEYLSEAGGLSEELFFHGGGDHFTIWSPKELDMMGPMFDGAKAACRRLRAAALAARKK